MDRCEVQGRICKIAAAVFDVPVELLDVSADLIEELGMDEISHLEIILEVERAFGVDLLDEATARVRTIGGFVRCVSDALGLEES